MFRQSLKSLYQQAENRFASRLSTPAAKRSISEFYKLKMLRDSKLMPQFLKRTNEAKNKMYQTFQSKRGFSSGNRGDGFNRFLERLVSMIPGGNVGAVIVGLNSFCYLMYLMWPRNEMYSYLNNFTFSTFNLG